MHGQPKETATARESMPPAVDHRAQPTQRREAAPADVAGVLLVVTIGLAIGPWIVHFVMDQQGYWSYRPGYDEFVSFVTRVSFVGGITCIALAIELWAGHQFISKRWPPVQFRQIVWMVLIQIIPTACTAFEILKAGFAMPIG